MERFINIAPLNCWLLLFNRKMLCWPTLLHQRTCEKKQQTLSHIHTHTHGKYERGPFLYTNALVLVRLHRMKSRVSTLPSIGLMAHIVKWNDINAEHSIMCVFSVRTADVIYHQQSVDLEFSIEHKAYGLAHICMPHHIVSHST